VTLKVVEVVRPPSQRGSKERDDSRPEGASYTLGPDAEFKYYRHPRYVVGQKLSRALDYYSLGVVLLEICLWDTIADLSDRDGRLRSPDTARQTLLKSYVPQLGQRMGALYQGAVRFCLEADDINSKSVPARQLYEQFRKKVVEPLALCMA
jgi:hypothetical protein